MFMISAFKISPIMLLRQRNFGLLSVWQLFYVQYKGERPLYCGQRGFRTSLVWLSEKGLSPESWLAI